MPIINGVDYSKIGADNVRVGKGGNSPMGRMLDHPLHYQSLLGEIVVKERPLIMIETGIESGFSTEHFLTSMDRAGAGHLFSCDPCPSGFYDANPISHPRFTFIRRRSYEALDEIFALTKRVDLFLHDSDHSFACQTFEYEWAIRHVRPGGIIASDDTGWSDTTPDKPHHAWDHFLARWGLTGKDVKIDNARWVRVQ
jgi:predicted O-methyltransferase YrrM